MSKTVLKLVDRLVAETSRHAQTIAEVNLWCDKYKEARDNLDIAKNEIENLKAEIQSLKNDIEIKDDTICRQYAAKEKLKERIKELEKDDTEGS